MSAAQALVSLLVASRRLARRAGVAAMACVVAAACGGGEPPATDPVAAGGGPQPASPQARAWQAIAAGALVVDLRSEEEFARDHLPGAVSIPYRTLKDRTDELGADKERTIVVYCRAGTLSARAAGELARLGFARVIDGGGLAALRQARPPAP